MAVEQGRKTLPPCSPGAGRRQPPVRSRAATDPGAAAVRAGRPRTGPEPVLGDKAYSSRGNRAYLRRRHIPATIPIKDDQTASRRKKGSAGGRPPAFDVPSTGSGTPWSAASTGTKNIAASPPATTSSPSATTPP